MLTENDVEAPRQLHFLDEGLNGSTLEYDTDLSQFEYDFRVNVLPSSPTHDISTCGNKREAQWIVNEHCNDTNRLGSGDMLW